MREREIRILSAKPGLDGQIDGGRDAQRRLLVHLLVGAMAASFGLSTLLVIAWIFAHGSVPTRIAEMSALGILGSALGLGVAVWLSKRTSVRS